MTNQLKHLRKEILKSQIESLLHQLHLLRIEKEYDNETLERQLYIAWYKLK